MDVIRYVRIKGPFIIFVVTISCVSAMLPDPPEDDVTTGTVVFSSSAYWYCTRNILGLLWHLFQSQRQPSQATPVRVQSRVSNETCSCITIPRLDPRSTRVFPSTSTSQCECLLLIPSWVVKIFRKLLKYSMWPIYFYSKYTFRRTNATRWWRS